MPDHLGLTQAIEAGAHVVPASVGQVSPIINSHKEIQHGYKDPLGA